MPFEVLDMWPTEQVGGQSHEDQVRAPGTAALGDRLRSPELRILPRSRVEHVGQRGNRVEDSDAPDVERRDAQAQDVGSAKSPMTRRATRAWHTSYAWSCRSETWLPRRAGSRGVPHHAVSDCECAGGSLTRAGDGGTERSAGSGRVR